MATSDTVSGQTAAAKSAAAKKKAAAAKNKNAATNPIQPDTLDRQELAAQYQAAVGIIYSVPELAPLFEQAVKEQWSPDKFKAAVQNSEWFRTNNEYARIAWAKENFGKVDGQPSADWQKTLDDAKRAVQRRATQKGAQLTAEEANALARRYIYEGWDQSTRVDLLDAALAQEITYLPDNRGARGEAGSFIDKLKQNAYANGLNYNDDWYMSAAKSVASNRSTEDDWLRDQQAQAASMFAPYAKQIQAGQSVYGLASPYINLMAQEWDMDPSQITLDTPEIRSALLGQSSQDGQWTPTSLSDFTQRLRNDPRWEKTAKAQNQITGITGRVMQMFGVMGG